MKLSEIKGEKAIEVFADLLDPVAKILADEDVLNAIRSKEPQLLIIQKMLKNKSKEVIKMMAILDDVPVEKYEVNFMTLPSKLLEIFNDPMVTEVFTLQGQEIAQESSGSVMENTGEVEK